MFFITNLLLSGKMFADSSKGLRLVLLAAGISGFSIFVNKIMVGGFSDPYLFTTVKNVLVAALLAGIVIPMGRHKELFALKLGSWARLAAIGVVGGGIPFLLFFKGLSMTSASSGAFIQKTMFLYVGFIALVFLKERLNLKHLAFAIVLLTGNAVAVGLNVYTVNAGDVLVLAATLLWALETVLAKKALEEVSPSIVACARMAFGSAIMLAFLGLTGRLGLVSQITGQQALITVVSAAILAGYVLTWFHGLKHLSAFSATAILFLGSPVTTALSALFLKAAIPAGEIAGGLIVLAALALYLKAETPSVASQTA